MWMQGVSAVIALLGVAVSANLLADRAMKTVRRARELSDLLVVLPPSTSQRDRLEKAIDAETKRALDRLERRDRTWSQRVDAQLPTLLVAIGIYALAAISTFVVKGSVAAAVGTLLTLVSFVMMLPFLVLLAIQLTSTTVRLVTRVVSRLGPTP